MSARQPDLESAPVCAPGSASQIIYAWAMDAPELELPQGVGFRVGGGTNIKYLVLQVRNVMVIQVPDLVHVQSKSKNSQLI